MSCVKIVMMNLLMNIRLMAKVVKGYQMKVSVQTKITSQNSLETFLKDILLQSFALGQI